VKTNNKPQQTEASSYIYRALKEYGRPVQSYILTITNIPYDDYTLHIIKPCVKEMGRIICFSLIFAIVGNAFQPYYHYRHQHPYRGVDVLHQKDYRRRLVQLSYAPTDPSIIQYNRQYLSDTLGFSEDKLDKIAAHKGGGNILSLEIGILDDRVKWLKNRLSLNDDQIKKIIQSHPNIPGFSIEENIELKLNWLQERLALDQKSLAKIITKFPNAITMSIKDNMEPRLNWLQDRLILDDTALSKIIQQMPPILGLSITDNMDPKLDWIQQRLLLTDEQLSKMIQRYTTIFGYNISNNLEPTLDFYIDALGESEAISFVTKNPSSFGSSLENRLKPRLEEAQAAGMKTDYTCLYHINKDTNEKWNKKVAILKRKRHYHELIS